MTWPSSDVNTSNADAGTDSPATFRTDVFDLINKFNVLRSHLSTLGQTLVSRATAALMRGDLGATTVGDAVFTATSAADARTALGAQAAIGYTPANDAEVVKLTGAQTVAGVKTFSSQPVLPKAPVLMTAQNTNTGTVVDFAGIPSWANRVTVLFDSWSDTGGMHPRVQLGTSTGPETSGYVGTALAIAGSGTSGGPLSAGFEFRNVVGAGASITGSMVLSRVSGNKWVCTGIATDTTVVMTTTGVKTLGAALDRIRITLASGALDAGTTTVYYE